MTESKTIFDFNDIFHSEVTVINDRRKNAKPARQSIVLDKEAKPDSTGAPVPTPKEGADLVGLALSGGGVRSAAFCLGALQALNETGVLKQVDYLSTVSGGGYIGCSLSAGLQSYGGKFPFESHTVEDETPSTQHIRNYSNYLFPNGAMDVLNNASIYARGLIANFVLLMPFLLGAAALTIFSYAGEPNLFGYRVKDIFGLKYFVITAYLGLLLLAVTIGWGLARSNFGRLGHAEIPSGLTRFVGIFVLLVFFSAFCELQSFVLAGMLDKEAYPLSATVSEWIKAIAVALAPLAAAIGFLGRKLGEFVKSAIESTKLRAQIAASPRKAQSILRQSSFRFCAGSSIFICRTGAFASKRRSKVAPRQNG